MIKQICLLLAVLCCWSGTVRAAETLPLVETTSLVAVGSAIDGAVRKDKSLTINGFVAQRLAFPRLLTWSLEVNAVLPRGFGANVIMDVIHQPSFRWHLLDPGVIINAFGPVTAPDVKRSYDVTFGTGVDWFVTENIALTANYRMFMPDPKRVILNYGSLILNTVNRMPGEGQLWIGASYTFSH